MAWYERLLKKIGKGEPVPQYYNPITDDYEVLEGEDGANFVKVKGDVSVKADTPLHTQAQPLRNLLTGSLTVTSTAVELKVGAARMSGRRQVILYAPSAGTVYYGTSGVTSGTGLPISAGQEEIYFDVDDSSPALFVVSDGINRTVKVGEVS